MRSPHCASLPHAGPVQPNPKAPCFFFLYVRMTPLLWWCLGRHGSSGKGSWANTESSPEEQVLLESGQVGEYCSNGTERSRYSSVEVMERTLSWSSTSCLNVGLCEGTACQHSRMIMYNSWVQLAGLSIRWPSFSSLKSSSTGIPGYGDPPRVKISHNNTP